MENGSKVKEGSKSRFNDFDDLYQNLRLKRCGIYYPDGRCDLCINVYKDKSDKHLKADDAFEYIRHDFYRVILSMLYPILGFGDRFMNENAFLCLPSQPREAFRILKYICIMKFFDGNEFINKANEFIQEYNTDIKPKLVDMYDYIKSQICMGMQREKLETYDQLRLNRNLDG